VPEMANVGAILLAAGASQGFGTESKLLAAIGGEPLVRRVARVLVRTGLKDLVVVTGHEQRICQQALEGLPVRYVNNTDWQSGMGSSIATGVSALGGEVDGAFIRACHTDWRRRGLPQVRAKPDCRRAGEAPSCTL
jgi:molybdenum cofactor cytidylyltransferase